MAKPGSHVLYGNFAKQYPTFVRGKGCYVFDASGKQYLDAIGGVGAVNIGHGVEEVVRAIAEQSQALAFTYGGVADNRPRQKLAEKLQRWAPPEMMDTRVFFCSGGAEANEAALKFAYQYHCERGQPTRRKVIGRWQSYHGNTLATLSLSGRTSWRRMYSPLLLDFPHIPPPYCFRCPWGKKYPGCDLPCATELRRTIQQEGPENISAFIVEPIIGTSMSAVVPPPEYYPLIRQICDEFDILLIADEVLSGVGRTGKKWGINHWDAAPDILTSSKGISGGYAPLGAAILSERVWTAISNGSNRVMHSYTYGGNPMCCAAGVAVLDYIERFDLISRAGVMGERLLRMLREQLGNHPFVGDVRGRGLFIGLEIVSDKQTRNPFPAEWNVSTRIEEAALKRGLLVLGGVEGLVDGASGDHVELLPPYIIEESALAFIVTILAESIAEATSHLPVLATGVQPPCDGLTSAQSESKGWPMG
jgi:adenosylmethionine-8-amino-7-oxononanoate aminotransferase